MWLALDLCVELPNRSLTRSRPFLRDHPRAGTPLADFRLSSRPMASASPAFAVNDNNVNQK
jgi:hypothetical protein